MVALEVSCLVIGGGRSDLCVCVPVSVILLLRFANVPPIDFSGASHLTTCTICCWVWFFGL